MLTKIASWFGNLFADKLVKRIIDFIRDFIEDLEREKQIKAKVEEIKNEKDAVTRAKRMRDLLNS
jgi:hypothetical protein